jgi:hypothetical protein
MRFKLVILLCAISCSASAQFWQNISFKKKHPVLPGLQPLTDNSITRVKTTLKLNDLALQAVTYPPCDFSLEAESDLILAAAKHNMRFRIYHDASYNFSDLAQVYFKLHRFSEAKWYFLQSNNISRQENDNRHTISNLVSLAALKIVIGDPASARADLAEARELARAGGFEAESSVIEQKMLLLAQNNNPAPKPDLKYAEAAPSVKKAL